MTLDGKVITKKIESKRMNNKSKFLQLTNEAPPLYQFGSEAGIPMLFHYTGFDSLLSITETKEMWATNLHYLNDYEEFKNALTIAKQIIRRLQKGQSNRETQFLEHMYTRIDTIEDLNLHIISFTANGDLLSQWRAYCPNGGVSVGFRYNDLQELAKRNKFSIRKCIYDEWIKNEIMGEAVEMHLTLYKEGENAELLLNGFITVLATISPCFKNQAFSEENEWRLVSEPISSLDPNVGVRARTHMMFPYFRFSLDGLPDKKGRRNLSFDRFIIGPSSNSRLSSSAMGYFLNKYKLSSDHIGHSQIPYRTL